MAQSRAAGSRWRSRRGWAGRCGSIVDGLGWGLRKARAQAERRQTKPRQARSDEQEWPTRAPVRQPARLLTPNTSAIAPKRTYVFKTLQAHWRTFVSELQAGGEPAVLPVFVISEVE